MPRIIDLAAGEGVIALVEIGRNILDAVMDFDAIMHPMHMLPDVGENQKIRPVADFQLEPLAQQAGEKIIGFGKPRPKIAEVKSNFHFFAPSAQRRFQARNDPVPVLLAEERMHGQAQDLPRRLFRHGKIAGPINPRRQTPAARANISDNKPRSVSPGPSSAGAISSWYRWYCVRRSMKSIVTAKPL